MRISLQAFVTKMSCQNENIFPGSLFFPLPLLVNEEETLRTRLSNISRISGAKLDNCILCLHHFKTNSANITYGGTFSENFCLCSSVVSVVVVSVVRKKFIGQIEFILSRTTSCICRFFCIEHLYGRFP